MNNIAWFVAGIFVCAQVYEYWIIPNSYSKKKKRKVTQ